MNHYFKRDEKKYIVSDSTVEYLVERINSHIKYSSFNKDGLPVSIRTTYLESDSHYIYHLKKSKKKSRFKIRLREYAIGGDLFDSRVWIELKEKVNGEGYKNRFLMEKGDVLSYFNGVDLLHKIILLNKSIDPDYLTLLYNTIQRLIIKNSLKPKIVVQYRRLAFDNGLEGSVRFTFDRDLISSIITEDRLFTQLISPVKYPEHNIIMEIKTSGTPPDIVKEVLKDNGLKSRGFSKFIFGMEGHDFELREPPDSVEELYRPISMNL